MEHPERNRCHSPESLRQRIVTTLSYSDLSVTPNADDRDSISAKNLSSPNEDNSDHVYFGGINDKTLKSAVTGTIQDASHDTKRVSLLRTDRPDGKTVQGRRSDDSIPEVLSWDVLKVRLSDVEESYYREDIEMHDGRKHGRQLSERRLDKTPPSGNISHDSENRMLPVESIFPPSNFPPENEDNIRTVVMVVTIAVTFLIGSVIVACIVHLCRQKTPKDSTVKKSHSTGTTIYPSGTSCGAGDGGCEGRGTDSGGTAAGLQSVTVLATEDGGEVVMSLVPGRDIKHEGPLRVYKWEDF